MDHPTHTRPVPRYASLDRLLLTLAWPRPQSYELARESTSRLEQTATALASYPEAAWAAPNLRTAVEGLRTRIGFVQTHWTSTLAALEPGAWDAERADALTADLAEIARAGAAIRDLIAAAHTPPNASLGAGARPDAARHRRTLEDASAAPRGVGGVAAAIGQLPPGAARLLLQALAIVTAAAIVTVVCYEAFDRPDAARETPGTSSLPRASRSPTGIEHTASQDAAATPSGTASSTGTTADSGTVSSLQVQLLGASPAQPRIEVLIYLDTTTTTPVAVQVSYRAEGEPHTATLEQTATGHTSYQLALAIDVAALCGRPVSVTADVGGLSASQTTTAGPCNPQTRSRT